MPIKSKAQRRKFAELLVEGKIEPETYERWNREAGSTELPERVRPRAAKKRAARKSTKARSTTKTTARKSTKRASKARKTRR
jgi:hypothetical protein